MIVDPDFLDHWRTRMVVDALGGDELAPTYILRLWAHCQTRKSDRFTMPPAGLKAQCRFTGDAALFEAALVDAGFVAREAADVHVLGWADQNAALLAAWENGARGGRPRKPKENPAVSESGNTSPPDEENETQPKPSGNPTLTHGEPKPNPDETDKSREEKIRPSSLRSEGERARAPHRPEDVSDRTWADWKTLRKGHKAAVTETAVDGARIEATKAGMPLEQFLQLWCTRGSRGLQADWIKPHERVAGRSTHSGFDEKDYRKDVQPDGSLI